jgi:hypothetical protein
MAGLVPAMCVLRGTSGGTGGPRRPYAPRSWENVGMNRIIYIVGLIVVVLAVLWFFGLR